MSTTAEKIFNGGGGKIHRAGSSKRLHSAWITHNAISMQVEYEVSGNYMPATGADPAETPVCLPVHIKVEGTDIISLLDDNLVSELAEKVERSWL
jgi:hypothetical protein